MTQNYSSEDEIDVFNIAQPAREEREVPGDNLAADAGDALERKDGKRKGRPRDAVVKGLIGTSVLVGAFWIAFPEWFSSSTPPSRGVQPNSSLMPHEAIQADAASKSVTGRPEQAPEPVVNDPGMGTAPFKPMQVPGPEVSRAVEDPNAAKLVEAINRLNSNQQELAKQLIALDQKMLAAELQKKAADVHQQPTKKVDVPLKPTLYRGYRQAQSRSGRGIAGYELNSVFRGMAWIQVGEKIHVVRPGDQLQDLTITAIDVPNRVVRTTRGDIR